MRLLNPDNIPREVTIPNGLTKRNRPRKVAIITNIIRDNPVQPITDTIDRRITIYIPRRSGLRLRLVLTIILLIGNVIISTWKLYAGVKEDVF